jgi:hypothetical protein
LPEKRCHTGQAYLLLTTNSIPDETECCPVLQTFGADITIFGDVHTGSYFLDDDDDAE